MNYGIFLIILNFISITLQNCVWYDECNEENGKIQNCLAQDSEPLPFENEKKSFEILMKRCPSLLEDYPGKNFCCNDKQLETMVKSMDYAAGIFARCPTCMINLNRHICLMTCSPNQTDFLEAVDVALNNEGKTYITEVNFYVTEKYMKDTYDSCKEIVVPSTGGKAVDISCGAWGASNQCTPERWFKFFGDYKENIVAPFTINYIASSNNQFHHADIKVLPCNESYESSKACSCSDCEASCTIPFEYSTSSSFTIGSFDGIAFILNITLGLTSVIAITFLIRHHYFQKVELLTEKPKKEKENEVQKFGENIKKKLENAFVKWGTGCARNPILVLAVSSWIVAILIYGTMNLRITTDPIEIWASPACKTRLEKTYFDTRFAPFYRTNQILIKSKGLNSFTWISPDNVTFEFGPAFNIDFLEEVYNLQMSIQELGVNDGKGLEKICFAPMKNEFFTGDSVNYCTIQSIWGYLQNDINLITTDTDVLYNQLQKCLRNNYDPTCLAPYGGPVFSPLAVGGHRQENQTDDEPDNYLLASGLSLTFLVNNAVNKTQVTDALQWEKLFIDFLKKWNEEEKPEFMEIAFSAERSIEDEIERESEAEIITIIVSYLVMFIYVTISLGRIRKFSSLLLETKFTLGLGGIAIVLASVFASLGVFAYIGVSTTLLTIEVIPFLVLAVGVDNIYILVHNYQESKKISERPIEENIGMALGKVGPSILLTTFSEAACFLIGTLSDMPAIKTFAEYSSVAILLNFLLQISCFVSILALDSKRQEKNFADIFCCVQMKKVEKEDLNSDVVYLIFKNYFGPFLMKTSTRISVIVVFLLWLFASISYIPLIEKGLDQKLSMPEDSYIINYFQFMEDLLSVGPPVYFVIKNGLNFTVPEEVNAVCGSVGCDSDSVVTYLTRASKLSNVSYIAKSPSSWIDDYFDWLLNSKECCKQFSENGSFCPHHIKECDSCNVEIVDWRPQPNDFTKYLPYFLNDNPDLSCTKAGHAAYAGGVNFEINMNGDLEVRDNYFMTYHTSLKTSRDFYTALENSQNIANHMSGVISKKLNRTVEIFSYSLFYVYYEQYLKIVKDSFISLGLSLLAVFGVTFIFTGFNLKFSALVLLVVGSILINMAGLLYWWNITLNAISLVNLIVAVGIGVEFCSHIVHAFETSDEPDKISKVKYAISSMGTSVFSGIALTKFLGIIVLAFAQTLMLRTFYFKMYLGIVVIGATHGLILMPVLLSYLG